MRRTHSWKVVALAVCAVTLGSLRVGAQGTPIDRKTADAHAHKTLRDVINQGADLYNGGDWNGCYRLYEGALIALKPYLDHHPGLIKEIDEGIAKAAGNPALDRRAFDLRGVIDKIRAETKSDGGTKVTPPPPPPPPPAAKLWDRLGGEANVKKVVDDFVAAAKTDKELDFTRGGKVQIDPVGEARLKKLLVDFVSSATGGPYKYDGKSMKEAHKGMAITSAQFDRSAVLLVEAMKKNGAKDADIAAVVKAVGGTKADIVEPAKPEPPKDKPEPPKDKPEPPKDKDKVAPPKDKPEPPKDKPEPPKDKPTPPKDKPEPPKDKPEPPKDKPEPPKDKPEPPKDKDKVAPPKDKPEPPKDKDKAEPPKDKDKAVTPPKDKDKPEPPKDKDKDKKDQ